MDIRTLVHDQKDYVIELRREFHQYPELSLQEVQTSQRIQRELAQLKIPYRSVDGMGVVATIQGNKSGKTIALRADIDGLPVTEQNEVEFRSKNQGLMHACGHDCHMAMLLGAGKLLSEMKNQLQGTVKLLFQPAEEVASGAKKMIAAGVLEGVDGVFGEHVWSDLETGQVCVQEGPRMASADFFTIRVQGKGGHGSAPQQGVDAVLVSSAIVMNLQSIVSREVSPLETVVVSIGSLNAGSGNNVLASEGILKGTTRTFNPEIRKKLPDIITRIIENTAQAYRAKAALEYQWGSAPIINDPEASKLATQAVQKIGAQPFDLRVTAGEDFSEFMNCVPGVFALVGVRNKVKGAIFPQHNPHYTVDEDALEVGTALYVQYALDFLTATRA
ncbi:M20 family metallopeptidase [Desulfitobacterium sp.]|uniref:M20 family metallopeptidase n=1 Tax=Desulfitobacterium sp. TaxID=49981 RepID=UPI002B979DA8|nr:M20 family metallopeptidase [Desulfitobacterium sp.]HVJ49934.1 M20 family metallopeptidase [Desulfitobacterium sp.]